MVELGTEKDIYKELRATMKLIKKEKNNDVRLALYNYIGNLYSGLSVIKGRHMYPNEKKIFGNDDNYQRFMKSTDFLFDRFNGNFIKNKDFHQDYFNDLLIEIESVFIKNIAGKDYSKQNDNFGEKEFFTVFHDFCQSLGLEKIFEELVSQKRIFKMTKGGGYDNFLGLTLHNPITGNSRILIDNFKYNLDSMFTLAHETGHYYDLKEFSSKERIGDFVSFTFKSVYQEVISRLFERLFLKFLLDQRIMPEKTVDKMIDVEIMNHDYILSSYILSLLDDELINNDKYFYLDAAEMTSIVSKYFEYADAIGEYIGNTKFDLMTDLNYVYGDILSMFLKNEVLSVGLDGELMRKFDKIRCSGFSEEFFLKEGLSPNKYAELYKKEVQLIKK